MHNERSQQDYVTWIVHTTTGRWNGIRTENALSVKHIFQSHSGCRHTSWPLTSRRRRPSSYSRTSMPAAMLLPPSAAASSSNGGNGKRGAEEPRGAVEKQQRRTKKKDETEYTEGEEGTNKGKDKDKEKTARGKKLTKAQQENKQLWSVVLKAVLSLQQDQRSTNAVILYTLIVETASPEIEKMVEQGKAYGQLCQDQPKHQQGPPHLFVFAGLLVALQARQDSIGLKNSNLIKSMVEKWEAWELDDRADSVRLCRQAKCWDQNYRKIYLAFGNGYTDEETKGLLNGMQQSGAVLKHGRAPAGALERELSQWLSAFADA